MSTLTPCRTLTLNRRSHLLSSPLAGRPALHLLAATTTTTTGSFVSRARAQSRTMARTQCQPGRLPSIRSVREGGAVGLQQTTGTVCLPGARTCKSYSVRPSVPSPPATNEHETCTARTADVEYYLTHACLATGFSGCSGLPVPGERELEADADSSRHTQRGSLPVPGFLPTRGPHCPLHPPPHTAAKMLGGEPKCRCSCLPVAIA